MAEPPPSLQSMYQHLAGTQPPSSSTDVAAPSRGDGGAVGFPALAGGLEGYDYDFVTSPDERYRCAICLLVLREPCQTPCGHLYCRTCILKWLRGSHNRCPVDNVEISEQKLFPDNFSRREVENFQAYCPNSKEGCDVVATVKHMLDHLKECLFALVPCPNKCSYVLRRKDLEDHIRSSCERRWIACADCGSNYKAIELKAHKDECPGVRIECRYCREEVTRLEVSKHEDSFCPGKIIFCTFHHLGCNKQMLRGELQSHLRESVTHHLNLLCCGVMVIFRHLNLQPLGTSGHPAVAPTAPEADMTQAEMMQAMAGLLPSLQVRSLNVPGGGPRAPATPEGSAPSSFFTPPSSLRAAPPSSFPTTSPTLHPHSSPSAQHAHLSSLPHHYHTDSNQRGPPHLHPPPPTTTTTATTSTTALTGDVQETSMMTYGSDPAKAPDGSGQNLSSAHPVRLTSGAQSDSLSSSALSSSLLSASVYGVGWGGKSWGSGAGSSWQGEHKLVLHAQELVALQGKVETVERSLNNKWKAHEQQLTDLEGRLCQGLFYWKIPHYSRYQREAEEGGGGRGGGVVPSATLHSAPFYTRPSGGYRLCLRANLNGVDSAQGSHLSLFVHFMQGEYDEVLDWPFSGRIVLSVVDQNPRYELRQHIEETLVAQPGLAAFQRPATPRNHKGFGYMEFLPLSALSGSSYVLDDTLIIKAHVLPHC